MMEQYVLLKRIVRSVKSLSYFAKIGVLNVKNIHALFSSHMIRKVVCQMPDKICEKSCQFFSSFYTRKLFFTLFFTFIALLENIIERLLIMVNLLVLSKKENNNNLVKVKSK